MTEISIISSTGGNAINGGNVALTYPAGTGPGDVSIVGVTLGTSKTTTLAVTSSSGGAGFYSQIVSTIQSSNVRFGVFRRVITSSAELGCRVTGTGGSTDSTSAVVFTFENVDRTTTEDVTATSTTGSGTTPDPISITVASCGCAIIAVGGAGTTGVFSAGPATYLNFTTAKGADTEPAATGMAWLTNASTAAANPGAFTLSVTATWVVATIALRRQFDQGFDESMDTPSYPAIEARRVVIRSY